MAAFAAGAASFLSPCVLPLVPGYVSYVAGQSAAGERGSLRTLGLSLCFVLGFTTVDRHRSGTLGWNRSKPLELNWKYVSRRGPDRRRSGPRPEPIF